MLDCHVHIMNNDEPDPEALALALSKADTALSQSDLEIIPLSKSLFISKIGALEIIPVNADKNIFSNIIE